MALEKKDGNLETAAGDKKKLGHRRVGETAGGGVH